MTAENHSHQAFLLLLFLLAPAPALLHPWAPAFPAFLTTPTKFLLLQLPAVAVPHVPIPAPSFPRTIYLITQRIWKDLVFQNELPTIIPIAANLAKFPHPYLPVDEKEMNTLVLVVLLPIPGSRLPQPTTAHRLNMDASNSLLLQTIGVNHKITEDNPNLLILNGVITGENLLQPTIIDVILPPTTEGTPLHPPNIEENLTLPTSVITGESPTHRLTTVVSHLPQVIIDVTPILQTIDHLIMVETCSLHPAQATVLKVTDVNMNIAASANPTTFLLRIATLTNTVASVMVGTG